MNARRPRPRTSAKTSPRRISAVLRATRALEMRAGGVSFGRIASVLGFAGRQGAYDACRRALDATLTEPAAHVRTLDLRRLDALFKAAYVKAIHGDLHAIIVCLRVIERRARLLGLDAPTKHDVTAGAPCGVLVVPGPMPLDAWCQEARAQQDALAEKESELLGPNKPS